MMLSLRTGNLMTGNKEYLKKLVEEICDSGKVFDEVWIPTSYGCPSLETCKKITEDMKAALEIFKNAGIVPSIQLSRTIGHSATKIDMSGLDGKKVNRVRSVHGKVYPGKLCLNSEDFKEYVYEACKIYAKCKPAIVWVDDDLRVRAPSGGGNSLCFCDDCIEKFNRLYNHAFTFETIKEPFVNDITIRKEYLEFMYDSLKNLTELICKGFNEVSPETVIALQSGADINLATDSNKMILSKMYETTGKKPGLRAGGGFYQDRRPEDLIRKALKVNYNISRAPEFVEMRNSEIENLPFIAYGKTNSTPCIEAALYFAFGCNMASVTLMNYSEDLSYHKKLFENLSVYKPYLEKVAMHNKGSVNGGICIYQSEKSTERVGEDSAEIWDNSTIYEAVELSRMGIPFHCAPKGCACLLTSPAVDALTEKDIEELLEKPVITDAKAIEKLIARGYGDKIGVKVRPVDECYVYGTYGKMTDHPVNDGISVRKYANTIYGCKDVQCLIEGENIEELTECWANEAAGNCKIGTECAIFTTSYGAKWGVKAINLTGGLLNFSTRTQILNIIKYISDGKVPAYLTSEEQVMVIPRINSEGKTVSVTLFNLSLGDYTNLELTVNNPLNEKECTILYPFEEDKKCTLTKKDEGYGLTIDSLERWRIKTIIF